MRLNISRGYQVNKPSTVTSKLFSLKDARRQYTQKHVLVVTDLQQIMIFGNCNREKVTATEKLINSSSGQSFQKHSSRGSSNSTAKASYVRSDTFAFASFKNHLPKPKGGIHTTKEFANIQTPCILFILAYIVICIWYISILNNAYIPINWIRFWILMHIMENRGKHHRSHIFILGKAFTRNLSGLPHKRLWVYDQGEGFHKKEMPNMTCLWQLSGTGVCKTFSFTPRLREIFNPHRSVISWPEIGQRGDRFKHSSYLSDNGFTIPHNAGARSNHTNT